MPPQEVGCRPSKPLKFSTNGSFWKIRIEGSDVWIGVDLQMSASGEKPVEAARRLSGLHIGPVHGRSWVASYLIAFG